MNIVCDMPFSFYDSFSTPVVVHCDKIDKYEKQVKEFEKRNKFFCANYYENDSVEPSISIKEYIELIAGYTPDVFVVPHHIGDYGLSLELSKEFFEMFYAKNVLEKYESKPVIVCPLEGDNVLEFMNTKYMYDRIGDGSSFTKVFGLSDGSPEMMLPLRHTTVDYIIANSVNGEFSMYHLLGYNYVTKHRNIISMNTSFPFSFPLSYTKFREMDFWEIDVSKTTENERKAIQRQIENFVLLHNK